jgi:ERF superfamily
MQNLESTDIIWAIKQTPTLGKFHKALAKAQTDVRNPVKNKTAKIGANYSYDYADLAGALDGVRDVLSKNGMAFYQVPTQTDGGVVLATRLAFEDEWIEATFPLVLGSKMTDLGAQITFLRRYQLFPMAGIAGEDDVEGDALNATTAKVVVDEQAQISGLLATFADARSVEELEEQRRLSKTAYEALSVVGQAAVRRSYIEFERKLKNGGNTA